MNKRDADGSSLHVNHTQNAVVRSGRNPGVSIHSQSLKRDLFFDDASSGGVSVGRLIKTEADFIRSIFQRLDPLIDLDFNEVPDFTNSDLDIYSLASQSTWSRRRCRQRQSARLGQWRLLGYVGWKDTDGLACRLSDFDANTIVHQPAACLAFRIPTMIQATLPGQRITRSCPTTSAQTDGTPGSLDADLIALQSHLGRRGLDPITGNRDHPAEPQTAASVNQAPVRTPLPDINYSTTCISAKADQRS